ncbi:DUF2336 domain-containing protein [Terasakiella pusilla]|uniref:DUF2336 domain-containing protein n=1 Tax=Terasakiella pusilla TaxID=64973 RepID=UPI003AA7D85F
MSEVTQKDAIALYKNDSPDQRAVLALKLGHDINSGTLSETELALAIAICEQLSEDIHVAVRQSLAQTLRKSTDIPKELALKLAQDVLEVSLPMIKFSELLADKDLISLVRSGDKDRQLAITQRKTLSPVVSHTLVEEGDEEVVESLLHNDGADIEDETLEAVLDRFQNSPAIHTGMAQRHKLPKHVVERMVDLVSDQIKTELLVRHPLSEILLEKMMLESREDAVRRILSDPHSKRDAALLVKKLSNSGKLSAELIFRALEIGDRAFFEHAMAERVGIDLNSTLLLIKDPGERGFAALYRKAGLPQKDFQSINYLVDAEYRSKRHTPITSSKDTFAPDEAEPESWLTATKNTKSKWRLF